MKKVLTLFIFGILLLGIASAGISTHAIQSQGAGAGEGDENNNAVDTSEEDNDSNILGYGQLKKIESGKYELESGEEIQISEKAMNKFQLRIGNFSADCNCSLVQEKVQNKTRLKAQLSNGRNAEVKIMPNTASERALERLRLKVCSAENNCTIELKEVGKGDNAQLAYEVQIERHSRILGIFQKKMQVRAQVSAENGEIVRIRKPWWAFIAVEPEEEN